MSNRIPAIVVAALMLVATVDCACAQALPDPREAIWQVVLEDALPDGKALELHLAVHKGRITHALAIAPAFNRGPHDLDSSKLSITRSMQLRGEASVTIQPDNYVPKDGQPIKCRFRVDAVPPPANGLSRYEGEVAGKAVKGDISIRLLPHAANAEGYGRIKVRLPGALMRLYRQRGPNWKYALDMNLTIPVRDGKPGVIQLESVVPDYRRYSAIVQRNSLSLEGHELGGAVVALVDYGNQGRSKDFKSREETYTYTLRGTVIGDVVAGAWDVRYGEERVENQRFIGSIDRTPPPRPTQSIAKMRLHKAMGEEWPVILNLSLADDGLINGFAWASGYNHQPHTVDASGMMLKGDRLQGEVAVTIAPDCYRPPEVFTMRYRIDARISDAEITGSFTGNDSKKDVKGAITGMLRAKRQSESAITMANVAASELDLGYSLVSGPMPKKDWQKYRPNYARVVLQFEDGKLTDTSIVNPHKADLFAAANEEAAARIDGDRFTASVAFDLTSEAVAPGRYRYTFEAIIDGDRLIGYWRGWLNDKPIYTKSAKLSGALTARKAGEGLNNDVRTKH